MNTLEQKMVAFLKTLKKNFGVTEIKAELESEGSRMNELMRLKEIIDKVDLGLVRKTIHFGVNIETYLAHKNLDDILNQPLIDLVDTVTLGRVDMCGSLNLPRIDINCDQIYEIAVELFTKARKKGMRTTMGGGIAKEAIPFIKKLTSQKLLDRYETRKIVFNANKGVVRIEEGIVEANKFELFWLENKKNYYTHISIEDDLRIVMLRNRIPQDQA